MECCRTHEHEPQTKHIFIENKIMSIKNQERSNSKNHSQISHCFPIVTEWWIRFVFTVSGLPFTKPRDLYYMAFGLPEGKGSIDGGGL